MKRLLLISIAIAPFLVKATPPHYPSGASHQPTGASYRLTSDPAMPPDPETFIGPVVPNRIADKYIPAVYQSIGGYLGYRLNTNLDKRLLRIDSAIILSGFEHRPGSQTWIGEHVGKFLFSA